MAFTTLQSRLFFPLGQLLNVQVEIQGALALFDRIFEYLELDPVIVDAPDAVDLAAGPVAGRIRFRDVSFTVSTPRRAGRLADALVERAVLGPRPSTRGGPPFGRPSGDIDFEAEPGQLVALVGPSGLGKTTTTYLIPRLYDVEAGAVEIDGIDVRRIKLVSLGEVIGFRDPGDLPVPRLGPREPALRQARGDRGGAGGRDARGGDPRPDHGAARRATTRSSASAATSSRAARSSASRSPGSSSRTRGS